MHLFGEMMPDAKYAESLLVPSTIGSFLSCAYLKIFLCNQDKLIEELDKKKVEMA